MSSQNSNEQGERRSGGPVANQDFTFAAGLQEAMRATTPAGAAIHDLALEVIQRHLSFGRRGLVLCGASIRTGVTVTAASLAVALAEAGVSTLLVEANLRRPELDTLIRPASSGPGLLQFLRAEVDRYGAISMNVLENLAVVFAGGVAADADELLAARRFHEFADAAMRDFECVIVETPPANRYADARTVAVAVGYAAIVARRQFSFVGDAELLARQLRDDGVVVVGSIFNRG